MVSASANVQPLWSESSCLLLMSNRREEPSSHPTLWRRIYVLLTMCSFAMYSHSVMSLADGFYWINLCISLDCHCYDLKLLERMWWNLRPPCPTLVRKVFKMLCAMPVFETASGYVWERYPRWVRLFNPAHFCPSYRSVNRWWGTMRCIAVHD